MPSSVRRIAQPPKTWPQRCSSALVLRASNLFDSEFACAVFELEQHDMRGVRNNRPMRSKKYSASECPRVREKSMRPVAKSRQNTSPKALFGIIMPLGDSSVEGVELAVGSKAKICAHCAAKHRAKAHWQRRDQDRRNMIPLPDAKARCTCRGNRGGCER